MGRASVRTSRAFRRLKHSGPIFRPTVLSQDFIYDIKNSLCRLAGSAARCYRGSPPADALGPSRRADLQHRLRKDMPVPHSTPRTTPLRIISLADWGRRDSPVAQVEMPGLMATDADTGRQKPLQGRQHRRLARMTIQTAVLIETLHGSRRRIRWASCNIYSTQDHAAAALVAPAHRSSRGEGQVAERLWDYRTGSSVAVSAAFPT